MKYNFYKLLHDTTLQDLNLKSYNTFRGNNFNRKSLVRLTEFLKKQFLEKKNPSPNSNPVIAVACSEVNHFSQNLLLIR